jgi:hypothetical protein
MHYDSRPPEKRVFYVFLLFLFHHLKVKLKRPAATHTLYMDVFIKSLSFIPIINNKKHKNVLFRKIDCRRPISRGGLLNLPFWALPYFLYILSFKI